MTKLDRYTSEDIHWRLIAYTEKTNQNLDSRVWDEDGWISAQALFCPYYTPLEGCLGGDWGVILNPHSLKFGQLVFEHHWCGCPGAAGPFEQPPAHRSGNQSVDQWRKKR